MKKRNVLLAGILLGVFIAAPAPGTMAQTAAMKPVKLMANGADYPPTIPDNMVLQYFCKEVEKKTNNLITFRYAWSQSLTKRGEELDALNSKLADVSTITFAFYPTKLYLNNFARSVPFVSTNNEVMAGIVKQLYEKIPSLAAEWEKSGAKLLFVNMSNTFELQSRVPIVKLSDFNGKKIVISGVEAARWFKVTGAASVTVPLPERALALQTGMIDGSVLPLDISRPFGLHQYAKHTTILGLGAWPGTGIAINKKLFDSFPKEIQEIILSAADDARNYNVQLMNGKQEEAVSEMKKAGVTFHTLANEDRARWMGLMGNQPAEWSKKGEEMHMPAKQVMDTYLALIKASGHKFPREW